MRVLTPKSQRLEGAQLRCAGAYRGRPRAAPRTARQLRASEGGWCRAIHHGRAHPRGRPCAERRRPCNGCSGGRLCANADSGCAAAARRDERSQAGHAPCARARSRPVSSRPAGTVSAGHAAAAWLDAAHWDGASCQCATSRRSTRALRSGRGAQAQGSVRACECDGERAYLAAPTRSTGHRLASVWSSPDAAGRDRRGFVRRSGTALSGPCPTGV